MIDRFARWALVPGLFLPALPGCGGPEEAVRVELPVVVDPSGLSTVTTDLGYTVEVTEARLMVENVSFAIAGEAHTASLLQRIGDLIVPSAYAHPGHYQGGDVTGELRGRFVLDWLPGGRPPLGSASLLVGTYQSANFTFATARTDDGLAEGDGLVGHTAILRGRATKDAQVVTFTALIDSPADRALVGVPFEFELKETSTVQLNLRLDAQDPLEGDTLFDGLDFAALDADGDGQLTLDAAATEPVVVNAYNLLKRTLQTHDNYEVRATSPATE